MRPGDVASNLAWLLGEVNKELSRWTDPRYTRSRTRKPDNLLIVTNVVLSSVAEAGGIDTANREISRLVEKHGLGLAGWRLWHCEDLRSLLDGQPGVRTTYGYLTSGDVLAQIQESVSGRTVDVGGALTVHAAKDLLAQQWVRLGEAGDPQDERLPLGGVGVDLPAVTGVGAAEQTEDGEARQRTVAAGGYILARGERVGDHGLPQGSPRHLLVVGGPGQGKSTLTQLVCQAYRVSLLRESTALPPEVVRVMPSRPISIGSG